jgi:hypothetical protein
MLNIDKNHGWLSVKHCSLLLAAINGDEEIPNFTTHNDIRELSKKMICDVTSGHLAPSSKIRSLLFFH